MLPGLSAQFRRRTIPTDTRTPRQKAEDLFRPPATKVVLFGGRLYELDEEHPFWSRRLPPGEEQRKLDELNR